VVFLIAESFSFSLLDTLVQFATQTVEIVYFLAQSGAQFRTFERAKFRSVNHFIAQGITASVNWHCPE
jgi:hypothetical protein